MCVGQCVCECVVCGGLCVLWCVCVLVVGVGARVCVRCSCPLTQCFCVIFLTCFSSCNGVCVCVFRAVLKLLCMIWQLMRTKCCVLIGQTAG